MQELQLNSHRLALKERQKDHMIKGMF